MERKLLLFAVAALLTSAAALRGALAHAESSSISGIQTADMDRSVRPQDDLFQYANGAWLKKVPIPADRASYGVDSSMAERSLLELRDLIEETQTASDAEARKVSDLSSECSR